MGDVSELISEVYGTRNAGQPQVTEEDAEKIAQAQFFNQLCEEQGINIDHLDDSQVERLYKTAMDALAENAGQSQDDEQQQKEAAAEQEWSEKRAAAEKIAEVDALGRIMAHAYVDELKKIAQEGEGGGLPPALAAKAEEKKEEKKEEKEEGEEEAKESQARAEALIAALSKNASSSTTATLDELAANQAFHMLKEAGYEEGLVGPRLQAVLTLGLQDSTKIASAQTREEAQYVRALEFCEAAGFPVNWSQS
jgi:hypothetical protein